jgi:hypothetical protein
MGLGSDDGDEAAAFIDNIHDRRPRQGCELSRRLQAHDQHPRYGEILE